MIGRAFKPTKASGTPRVTTRRRGDDARPHRPVEPDLAHRVARLNLYVVRRLIGAAIVRAFHPQSQSAKSTSPSAAIVGLQSAPPRRWAPLKSKMHPPHRS